MYGEYKYSLAWSFLIFLVMLLLVAFSLSRATDKFLLEGVKKELKGELFGNTFTKFETITKNVELFIIIEYILSTLNNNKDVKI